MNRFSSALLIVLCLALLAGGGAQILLGPHKTVSIRENRYLSPFPRLTLQTLQTGAFTEALGVFCRDHVPARTALISLCSVTELLLGQRETNGILVGKDGFLIPKPVPRAEITSAHLSALSRLQSACEAASLPFSVFFAPRAVDVLPHLLPTLYGAEETLSLWQELEQAFPGSSALRSAFASAEAPEALHYRTDHHWSTDGAYLAYTAMAPYLGLIPFGAEAFERTTVTDSFLGTSDSRACLPFQRADSVVLYRYDGDGSVSVQRGGTAKALTAFYDFSALERKDAYQVFLGGNESFLQITLPAEEARPRMLLIKDSYANSLIPFLARHYDLDVVDPRYGHHDLSTLLTQADYCRVLVLFGADTVSEQAGLLS